MPKAVVFDNRIDDNWTSSGIRVPNSSHHAVWNDMRSRVNDAIVRIHRAYQLTSFKVCRLSDRNVNQLKSLKGKRECCLESLRMKAMMEWLLVMMVRGKAVKSTSAQNRDAVPSQEYIFDLVVSCVEKTKKAVDMHYLNLHIF